MLKPTIDSQISVCQKCELYKNCKLFPMSQFGPTTKAKLLVISNKPTKEEFQTNLPWYDLSHKKIIELVKQNIKFPVKYSYAIKCPGSAKEDKTTEFCLKTWLNREILDCDAKLVLFLGRGLWKYYAAESLGYNPKTDFGFYLNKLFVSNVSYAFSESPDKIYSTGDVKLLDFVKLLQKINISLEVL